MLATLLLGSMLFGQSSSIRFERLSIEQGLSQSVVNCIQQDRNGFLWFGTQDGLNRYDGYQFKVFWRAEQTPPDRLHSNSIHAMLVDRSGKLWIGTDSGLNWFDEEKQVFKDAIFPGADPRPLKDYSIENIYQDRSGVLWITTLSNGLLAVDPEKGLVGKYDHNHEAFNAQIPGRVTGIHQNSESEMWFGFRGGIAVHHLVDKTWKPLDIGDSEVKLPEDGRIFSFVTDGEGVTWFGGDYGLYRWDPELKKLTLPEDKDGVWLGPGDDTVWSILESQDGALWVSGIDGLYRIEKDRSQQSAYLYDVMDPHSMGREAMVLFEDASGVLWAGSYMEGLVKLPVTNRHFVQYRHHPTKANSLGGDAVRAMYVDRDNQLWIGTYEHGASLYRSKTDDFVRFQTQEDNDVGLPTNDVLDITQASDGNIWMATIGGVGIYDQTTQTWDMLTEDESSSPPMQGSIVYSLWEDKEKRMWLGSTEGLQILDSERREVATYRHDEDDPHSLIQNDVLDIWQDNQGRKWMATFGGVSRYVPDQDRFENYRNDPDNPQSLSNNTVLSFCQDKKGRIWLGTSDGLDLYREATNDFEPFGIAEGFPNMTIYGVLEDDDQYLWLSTNAGLIRFEPESRQIQTFDVKDGLQSNEFNQGGFAKDQNGRLYFGGINGISAFYPKDIQMDKSPPRLLLTEFLVRNIAVTPTQEAGPLQRAIYLTETIKLPYRDYLFAFEFAALNYNNPQKNQFAYQLEGLDEDWVYTDADNRRATYTKLEPGNYRFRVKGSNGSGVWNETGAQIKLQILPPFYRTWWAYTFYVLAILAIIFAFYAWRVYEVKAELARERVVNEKLQQLNGLKDDFLANTSHELRTPLNGMIGLAESLRDGSAGVLPQKANHNLGLIVQSGRRLSHLVNDLLDFSSLKTKTIQIQPKALDLHTLANVTITLLKPLADQKQLALKNLMPEGLPAVFADEDRLQQILLNLVGNAIKFTEKGSVSLHAEKQGDAVHISVVDTGPGIPEGEKEVIFRSFERGQAAKTSAIPGTGVGLALTSRLVKLHGGEISVANGAEQGAVFSFTLPIAKEGIEPTNSLSSEDLAEPMAAIQETWLPATSDAKARDGRDEFRVLIVDDDPINRQVLLDHLAMQDYAVTAASDGQEALLIIENSPPFDCVLLDIMMPHMSGYEVCRRLREHYSLHELPVIFLTAKNQTRDLVTGFDSGANDFITKPINKPVLYSRVRTHIKLLDTNRNLETKVAERTQQLRVKNETLENLNKALEELSLTDPMTHLGNRRYMRKHLDQETALVRRNYSKLSQVGQKDTLEDHDLLFLLFDLDHFKRINDTYGHLAGDEVLMQIKQLMEAVSREYDFLVRCGGEEFLIVFRKANRLHAASFAERLRKKIADHPFTLSVGPTVHMTASLGVAAFPFKPDAPDAWTWEQVLDIADQALYLAKENGRNAWAVLEATAATPTEHVIEDIRTNMEGLVNSGRLALQSSIAVEKISRWSKSDLHELQK